MRARPTTNILIVIALLFTLNAIAEDDLDPDYTSRHEIVLGTSGLLGFAGQTTGSLGTFNSGTSIGGSIAYNFAIFSFFQMGINSSIYYLESGTANTTVIQLMGGPTFNIPVTSAAIYNAFYVMVHAGLLKALNNTEFGMEGELGFRLRLVDHVALRPGFGAFKVMDGSNFIFTARPLQFAVLF